MSTQSPAAPAFTRGFCKSLSGTVITYDSPLPEARSALICRATDGHSAMAWESAAVPRAFAQLGAELIWLAGLGCNLGEGKFILTVNGAAAITFTTTPRESWEVKNREGLRLHFTSIMVDRHGDRFGFMRLIIPGSLLPADEAVRLDIRGEAAGSQAWVMTFMTPLAEGLTVTAPGFLLRHQDGARQPLHLSILHFGDSTTARLWVDDQAPLIIPLRFGITRDTLMISPLQQARDVSLSMEIDGVRTTQVARVEPVRPWTLHLVQHTHTDIGYTRPQTDILAEHIRYIDYALDYCDQTDALPDAARFRWTCETSWAVQQYLATRPRHQIARLKKRVEEGRIEITAQLLNWSEMADENALVHSLQPLRTFLQAGFSVHTAMQNDVNGYAWCLVDYFSGLDIKYATSGINAHRALKPFTVPKPFWWESPSGKRILAFRADHYMTGNLLGLLEGALPPFEAGLSRYLSELAEHGYPHDEVCLQFSGYFTDNAPPSTAASEMIRSWNRKYIHPQLRTATMTEFMQTIEKRCGAELPVYRAAWPDWWSDGFGCAMRETAAGRTTQAELIAHQGVLAMAQLWGAELPAALCEKMNAIAENLNFYNEHTFGAAESITDPEGTNSQVQWSEKSAYVWQAVMQSRLLREAAMGQLQPLLPACQTPSLLVFNTLNWQRSGLLTVFIDRQILPKESAFVIVDDQGEEIDVQHLSSRAEGNHWALWVPDVPAMGYKQLHIKLLPGPRPEPESYLPLQGIIENDYYRLKVDMDSGSLCELYDRALQRELLDPAREWHLGQLIYERLADRQGMEALRLGEVTRTSLHRVHIEPGIDGPLWQSFTITGACEGFKGARPVAVEVRVYRKVKRLQLSLHARKRPVTDPEALYVAFPFALDGGALRCDVQGGILYPGENQLEGTANDWNTVQNFASLAGEKGQIVLTSPEVPLMQFGAITTGRYQRHAKPASRQIYSWVLNNYWTTNFRASQEGEIACSYALTSSADASLEFATRFGWEARVPLLSRVLPGSPAPRPGPAVRSAWPFQPGSVLLVASKPLAEGVLLHLREVSGRPVTLNLVAACAGWKLTESDALGRKQRPVKELSLEPFEVKFVHVSF